MHSFIAMRLSTLRSLSVPLPFLDLPFFLLAFPRTFVLSPPSGRETHAHVCHNRFPSKCATSDDAEKRPGILPVVTRLLLPLTDRSNPWKTKVAFVAGVADSSGYGWAICKALAEAGATVTVGTWPPVLGIFEKSLKKGSFDEDMKLEDGSKFEIAKVRVDARARV